MVDVHDVDLQTTGEGAFAIEQRLEDYVVHKVEYRQSEKIRSCIGALRIQRIRVEIMGDLQKSLPGGGCESQRNFSTFIHRLEVQGWSVPVLDLELEYRAYCRLSREEKVGKIRAV